ncbi:MFS transporter [Pyxidicoccus parkwayensis]|uniref:MFS transporter n=1 Tax=Pyxidicoccus parkwayensis TaxID=2813578 RepID=A0ABX7NT06_9BACT|nr:MFS transporter [Pyxidicoccus parkwaysis]QSQ22016.1 MFS transporter [Pyxidicoccus parkwaysis]
MQRTSPRAGSVLALAYLAFISLGLPDGLLGVAWPSLRDSLGLHQALLGAPVALAAGAYFVSGMLAGRLMQGLGIGLLLAGSTASVAAGTLGISAAPLFALILVAAVFMGFGSGAIDSALNTYAARNFSPKHMSWLHAAYAAGATTGPAIMTTVLNHGASWRVGYAVVGGLLAVLAIAFAFSSRRWDAAPAEPPVVLDAPGGIGPVAAEEAPRVNGLTALRSGTVWLQLAIFFIYTGIEVAAGQWSYTLLTEERGLSKPAAGTWVAAYWGGLLAGRLVLGFVVERLGQVRLIRLATVGVLVSAGLFAIPGLKVGALALPLLSFSLASIFPGLMAETPRRVGVQLAPHAVGFQVSAATLGIAVLPSLAGLVSEHAGLWAIAPMIACCALGLFLLHERLVATADRRTEGGTLPMTPERS